ncbi:hypothetical protein BT93_C2096 [Corymbia citriodora subsp. variegata]|nr:hypothetical protein BT93_C2096 [Corymbia citriodora subsp. variegata]
MADEVNGRDGKAVSPDLPADIIHDILVRLPVKTLLRFKCVSKPSRSIISDPSFADSFLARSLARPAIAGLVSIYDGLDHQMGLSAPIPLPDLPPDLLAKILKSIHSFFILADRDLTLVCNPSTREGNIESFAALGYDPASKQYKVLKTWILHVQHGDEVAAHKVLTLDTNSWRTVDDCPIKFPWDDCISAEGAIHILTHDLMKFRMLLPPGGAREGKVELKLFREHLALLECRRSPWDDMITMYVLDDYGRQAWKELRMVLPHNNVPVQFSTFFEFL